MSVSLLKLGILSRVLFVVVMAYEVLCAYWSNIYLVWIVCGGLVWVDDFYVAWSMGLGKPC